MLALSPGLLTASTAASLLLTQDKFQRPRAALFGPVSAGQAGPGPQLGTHPASLALCPYPRGPIGFPLRCRGTVTCCHGPAPKQVLVTSPLAEITEVSRLLPIFRFPASRGVWSHLQRHLPRSGPSALAQVAGRWGLRASLLWGFPSGAWALGRQGVELPFPNPIPRMLQTGPLKEEGGGEVFPENYLWKTKSKPCGPRLR